MSKKSIYDRDISYQEYKALRERQKRGEAPSPLTDKKRERLAMRSPEILKFLAEEQAEVKRLEQIRLEKLTKAAGEILVAREQNREEQARKQREAEEQERQDKELQRAAWKKILDQPVRPPAGSRKKTKVQRERDNRDRLIWLVVQKKPKNVRVYCQHCNGVGPNPNWLGKLPRGFDGKRFDMVKLYDQGLPWPKRIAEDRDRAVKRYQTSHPAV